MKRILIFTAAAVVLVLTLAACGAKAAGGTAASAGTTVTTRQISGIGTVLTDSSGMALYTTVQERPGTVLCNGTCLVVWPALTVAKGSSPTGTSAAGTLGVVTRTDGTRQVTLNGKPLYTFISDHPGQVNGNNFADSFNGQHFTWRVVTVSGSGSTSGSSG